MKQLVTLVAALAFRAGALAQGIITDGTRTTIISRDGSTVSSTTSSGSAGSVILDNRGNSVTSSTGGGSVILDNQGSVTSSTTIESSGTGSTSTSHSISGRTGSMCNTVYQGVRCEISCQAPQVAQCGIPAYAGGPACFCQ